MYVKEYNDLIFDKRLGIYKHKKTGDYYCPSCLAEHIRSPLKEMKHGWICGVLKCKQFYENPDYKEPPYERIRKPSITDGYM